MKSIKEKALDIYPKMSRISEPHGIIPACNKSYYLGDANEEKREGFETGANYVLEQIEHACMKGVYPREKYDSVLDTIKQLRSNQ